MKLPFTKQKPMCIARFINKAGEQVQITKEYKDGMIKVKSGGMVYEYLVVEEGRTLDMKTKLPVFTYYEGNPLPLAFKHTTKQEGMLSPISSSNLRNVLEDNAVKQMFNPGDDLPIKILIALVIFCSIGVTFLCINALGFI